MSEIALLLTTYNSEKHLRPQLDSLFAQSWQDFKIYVHDDGSDDDTLQILAEYQQKYPQLILLQDPKPGRLAKGSFIWLLENTEADYYMFCDHDDVWLDDKIEKTYSKMLDCEQAGPGQAVVINTDLKVVDEQLNEINPSFWAFNKIKPSLLKSFDYLTVCNAFTGCTMMINRAAKELALPVSEKALMHDKWIALKVAAEGGILDYLEEATVLYRQHGENQIGARKIGLSHYLKQLCSLTETWKENRATLEMSRAILKYSWAKYLYYKLLYALKRSRVQSFPLF
ncbi:MAG: glycosyltransferase family 2 protein [Bacteroidales bacterium]|nr:glycosyltransferase family 2 protein [Bacteroidales bacterium]MDD4640912.1 glycosyltransferase family 2 protein [Bacteroidales bacterium]